MAFPRQFKRTFDYAEPVHPPLISGPERGVKGFFETKSFGAAGLGDRPLDATARAISRHASEIICHAQGRGYMRHALDRRGNLPRYTMVAQCLRRYGFQKVTN